MITKIIFSSALYLFSVCCFSLQVSCPSATPSQSNFCGSFKVAAECHCMTSGLPKGMCANMDLLYARMISTLGSLQRACEYQHNTSVQECIDDWNCYRFGGVTSQNQLCSGTGAACV